MKIVVMHQASIGDTLLATPVYRAIKEKYPKCYLLVVTSEMGYELLNGIPYIDELIIRKGKNIDFTLIKKMWHANFAIILDYHYKNALHAFLSFIPKRIGRGKSLINIRMQDKDPLEYEPIKYSRLLAPLDIRVNNFKLIHPNVKLEEKERVVQMVKNFRGDGKKLIVLAPFSLSSLKDWEPEKYCEIIKRLKKRNCCVVAIGGPKEKERIANEYPMVVNLAGSMNLRESAELISHADLQICGCTAMLHVAATSNTPIIAIYGPTDPGQWAPKTNCRVISHPLECSPCYPNSTCQNNRCIKEITVDEVWDAIKEQMSFYDKIY